MRTSLALNSISGEVGTALTVGGAGLGFLMFLVGLGLVLHGKMLSRPRGDVKDNSPDADFQNLLDAGYTPPELRPKGEAAPTFRLQTTSNLTQDAGPSVTEHTTHQLKNER